MSTQFEVLTDDLRKAGAAGRSAAEQAAAIDLSAELDVEVAIAMPGSCSAVVAADLVTDLRKRMRSWSESAIDYAERLVACADAYDEHEATAQQRFRRILNESLGGGW